MKTNPSLTIRIYQQFILPLWSYSRTATTVCVTLSSVCLLTACAAGVAQRSQKLELDMPKDKAVRIVGHRYSTLAARKEGSNGHVEVVRFSDKRGGELLSYFRDGKLVQWGDLKSLQNMPE